MPVTTRCKFVCQSITKSVPWGGKAGYMYTAKFSVVSDDSEENKKFFSYTPCGTLEIGTYTEDRFEPGKEYFLDISVVEPVAA